MVIDHLEETAVEPSPADQPVGRSVVPTAAIMTHSNGQLNIFPVEFTLPGAALRVVSPVEPLDHSPLRGRDRVVRPGGYFRFRRTVCKMPPLLM
jgi:hypothetical protein